MDPAEIQQLKERLTALERVVFGANPVDRRSGMLVNLKRRGPTEGVRDLIGEGFFRMKRPLREVRGKLEELGFVYSAQAVDVALTRNARRDGALVLLREGGKKLYVERR